MSTDALLFVHTMGDSLIRVHSFGCRLLHTSMQKTWNTTWFLWRAVTVTYKQPSQEGLSRAADPIIVHSDSFRFLHSACVASLTSPVLHQAGCRTRKEKFNTSSVRSPFEVRPFSSLFTPLTWPRAVRRVLCCTCNHSQQWCCTGLDPEHHRGEAASWRVTECRAHANSHFTCRFKSIVSWSPKNDDLQ